MTIRQQTIKYEDGYSTMELPSSPFNNIALSSRRDSLISSNFSATSPIGTAGPNTPSSYGSQMSTEPFMSDMSMTDGSFTSSTFSNSYDNSFTTNEYEIHKSGHTWSDTNILADNSLNINLHLDTRFDSIQRDDFQQVLYDINQDQDQAFHGSKQILSELPWIDNTTIVPGQLHNRIQFPTSLYTTPVKARTDYPNDDYVYQVLSQQQQQQHLDQNKDFVSPERFSPSKQLSGMRQNIKQRKTRSSPSKRSSAKNASKPESQLVSTKDGYELCAESVPKAAVLCAWPNCGKLFQRMEHMRRHLKSEVSKANAEGIEIPDHVVKLLNKGDVPAEEVQASILEVTCEVCTKDEGKEKILSRHDNLIAHYEKVHFSLPAQAKGRLSRMVERDDVTNELVYNWDLIRSYSPGVEEKLQRWLQKLKDREQKDAGVIDQVPVYRSNCKVSRQKSKKQTRKKAASSMSSTRAEYGNSDSLDGYSASYYPPCNYTNQVPTSIFPNS